MKKQNNITLYGVRVSPYVRKVWVALKEKEVAFEHVETLPLSLLKATGQRVSEQFKKASPLGNIPALTVGDEALSDSAVIAQYLDCASKNGIPLYPVDPMERARAMWLEMYSDTVLSAVIYSDIFIELCIKPSVLQQAANNDIVKRATEQALPPLLRFLDSQLGNAPWFVSNTMSMADVAIVTQLLALEMAGVVLPFSAYPKLTLLLERARQRRSFQSILLGGEG